MFKKSKYFSKKTVVDNIKFDSKKEAKRYIELRAMQNAGLISNLEMQPKFELQRAFTLNGINHRAISYKPDFKYYDLKKEVMTIEDVKGGYKWPETYNLKRKMFMKKYLLNKPTWVFREVI